MHPQLIALVLPNGSTRFTRYERNQWGKPTQVVDNYATASGIGLRTNIYGYDGGWNMTQRTVNGSPTSYTVNDRNQVTAISGLGSATFDANGPKTYTYVYDDENRLVEMRTDTGYTPDASRWRSTWVYDGLGRARRRNDLTWYPGSPGGWYNLGETRFLYDGRRVIQERNSGNTPTVSYTRGNDLSGSLEGAGGIGGLLGRSDGYSGGNWSTHNHYHADGGGNITYLVNSSQGLAAAYRYDPYGRVIGWSGSLTNANVYRFSSKEVHAKSGMYGYGFRFYDPHLQRWLNRDPIFEAGGINLYGFVGNNPMMFVDPFGEAWYDWGWIDPVADWGAGLGDGLSLGLTGLGRSATGLDDVIDPCSTAYKVGGWTSIAAGTSRLAYAGLAKAGSMLARSGAQASQFRDGLKEAFRLGLGRNWRKPNLANKTDAQLRASAGRTNPYVNAYGGAVCWICRGAWSAQGLSVSPLITSR